MLDTLASNKFFVGLCIILMNVGTKYVLADITEVHEVFLNSSLFKLIVLFCIFFISTRDVMVACMLTFGFQFTVQHLAKLLVRQRLLRMSYDGYVKTKV
jgi:hypothetical protein